MSDIVERLRAKAATAESRVDERTTLAGIDVLDEKARIPMEPAIITLLCRNGREAADEIERLRAELDDTEAASAACITFGKDWWRAGLPRSLRSTRAPIRCFTPLLMKASPHSALRSCRTIWNRANATRRREVRDDR